MATSFTALITVAPQAPLLTAILHAAVPSTAHPPEPIGTFWRGAGTLGQLYWQFRAVSVSLIFDSIELDLSMTKTRLKAAAHLGTAGGLGGNGGGVDERPNPGKMVSRIVQANQVAADVMRTGTNVLQGGWTLKQGGAPHRDAMRSERGRLVNLNRRDAVSTLDVLGFCWFRYSTSIRSSHLYYRF
jgi:hypothetical protein